MPAPSPIKGNQTHGANGFVGFVVSGFWNAPGIGWRRGGREEVEVAPDTSLTRPA